MNKKAEITGLTAENTLQEYFDFFAMTGDKDQAAQVVPIMIHTDPLDTRYVIIVKGENKTAVHIMTQLMQTINDMYDSQQQHAAEAEDEPRIIT